MSFPQSLAPQMEKMSLHQYFFPEMAAHDISCPVALGENMSKIAYVGQAEVDDFIRSNHQRFKPRTFNNSLLYQPLVEAEEIRVLEIHPAPSHSDIECTLRHCYIDFEYSSTTKLIPTSHALSRDRAPLWYTALSYSWGLPQYTSVIKCNGFEKRITPNLEAAIRYLRNNTATVIVWIDQICINQDDIVEKARQVQLMGSIYKRAFSTIIWLGETSAQIGIELLQRVHEEWKFSTHEVSVEQLKAFRLPNSRSEAWQHLCDLFCRPWFRRLWIIQEVVLSHRPYVLSGAYIILWSQFSTPCSTAIDSGFMEWLEREENQDASPVLATCRIVAELSGICDYFQSLSAPPELCSTLVDTRYAETTNPSDKVYGVLGICSSKITVDYSLPTAEVFQRATASILEEEHRLYKIPRQNTNFNARFFFHVFYRVLSCVDHMPEPNIRPSWVPDWARPRQTDALGYSTSALSLYAAGGVPQDFTAHLHLPPSRNGEKKLTVLAYVHDNITDTVVAGKDVDLSNMSKMIANSYLVVFADFARRNCHAYCSSLIKNELFSAFWHTMVAGRDGSGRGRCPSSYDEIFSLLLDTATGKQPSLPGQTYSQRRLRGFMTLDSLGFRTLGQTFADLRKAHSSAVKNRALCATAKGYLGLVPKYSTQGDVICVLAGYPVPFVLRDLGNGTFHLLGECYIYGIMSGELEETAVYRDVVLV